MEQTREQATTQAMNSDGTPTVMPSSAERERGVVLQGEGGICTTCGDNAGLSTNGTEMGSPAYVFALGRIETRFPSLGVEKEFMQVMGRTDTAGKTDRQAFQSVFAERHNRYLARRVCWVFLIEGLETYILQPEDPTDFDLLMETLRGEPRATDVDLIIGVRGPIAPPEMCNGLMVPIVVFSQIYSFDRDALIKAIPKPEKMAEKQFGPAAGELFDRIMQIADNAGATDEHRALNYVAVRYPTIYSHTADMFARDFSLTAVEAHPSRLSAVRNIVDVIFTYTNRNTDFIEKFFVRVDVTEESPFLVTKLSPYFDR